jgi:hypothetical protein
MVGEGLEVVGGGLLGGFQAPHVLGVRGVVADVVGSVDLVRRLQVPAAEELFLLPTDQGLVLFRHGTSFFPTRFPGASSKAFQPRHDATNQSPARTSKRLFAKELLRTPYRRNSSQNSYYTHSSRE